MEAPTDAGQARDKGKILQVTMIVLIVLGSALIGYVLYQRAAASDESQSTAAIKAGDTVTMNYIGRLPDRKSVV